MKRVRSFVRCPQDEPARHAYNFAVGRIIETIWDAKLDPWTQPLRVPVSGGDFLLTHKPDPRPQWNPALYTFTPADQFDVHGKYVTERTVREGMMLYARALRQSRMEDEGEPAA